MENRGTPYNVLFLSSSDCARSLMAEAILNHEGRGRFRAYSAGINGSGPCDQIAVSLLKTMQFEVGTLRSQDWSELAQESGPAFDFVFTLSEEAKLLPQSMWKGRPIFAHWSLPDPARVEGNEATVRLAYADTFRMLSNRISSFANLPLRSIDMLTLMGKLDSIGEAAASRDVRSVA